MTVALKHSSAPWFVVKSGTPSAPRYVISSPSGDIAEIYPCNGNESDNATLIALAPDMETNLKEYEDLLVRYLDGDLDAMQLSEELSEIFEIREAFANIAKEGRGS